MSKPGKPRRPKLNNVSYADAAKVFVKLGFAFKRQDGSHMIFSKPGHAYNVVIPAHRPVKEGTLRQCIRAAGITEEQFAELL